MASRKREYEFYARHSGAPFTARRGEFYRFPKARRVRYRVRATSLSEAYELARRGSWATGPRKIGLLRRKTGRDQRAELAPYLTEDAQG